MALSTKTVSCHTQIPYVTSLATAITSCLQALNPRKPDPSHINPSPLNQFSHYLQPQLVIEVIIKQVNPYHALFFFNWASNPHHNPNCYTHTHQCYVAITDLLLAHSLFSVASSLLQKSNRLSDLMASKFITAYGNRGHVKGAIFWFHKAKTIANGNCLFSCNAILNVLVTANRISLAQSFFDEIVNDAVVKTDVSTYSIMIRGYCKTGMIENARKVFDEMGCEPNVVSYNTMINGYCKKGDMDKAITIFYRLLESQDCLPDTVTYTTIIDGYCKKGEFDKAMKWMDEMKLRCCKPNLLTYNAIIYGLCLRGNVDEAKKLMTQMRLNGLKENLATHMSMLKGLCYAGRSDEAVNYFKEIIRKGMKPDAKAYGIVVNEYCKMRIPNKAISLLKEMQSKGINPSVGSFNVVLRTLMESGELDMAIFLLKQMRGMGCKPNFISYSMVIGGLCRANGRMQDVEEILKDMLRNGIAIGATMCSSLVMGYCEDGNEQMAKQVFYETIDKNYVISPESFSIFVKQLCEMGKAVEVQKIFKEMCERCSIVDVDSYWRILDEQLVKHMTKGGEEVDTTKQ
ncbi:hypothetical protein P3X46_007450 [Hevea brasiliensis]|uniref:Pentacotripeptide-repeat region of PRORP domain-containing protein n=2 Tax=Hevea brasiliensis TaxID=3981 RepID=A0ABQ9MXF5_HEVBR|nr:hypothetical protein P3X46_007450 [Hevea brasiliensis]